MAAIENTNERVETPRAMAKRRQILDAAQSLFLEHGFEGTSMDAITAAAGVSKRTLYKYYASKEDLLGDMVHSMTLGRAERSPWHIERLVVANPADLERVLLSIACAIVENHRTSNYFRVVRVVIAEGARYPQLGEQFMDAVVRPGMTYLASIIDRARELGVVNSDETDAAVRLFIGGIIISSFENALLTAGEPHWLTPDQLRTQVRLLVAAIT